MQLACKSWRSVSWVKRNSSGRGGGEEQRREWQLPGVHWQEPGSAPARKKHLLKQQTGRETRRAFLLSLPLRSGLLALFRLRSSLVRVSRLCPLRKRTKEKEEVELCSGSTTNAYSTLLVMRLVSLIVENGKRELRGTGIAGQASTRLMREMAFGSGHGTRTRPPAIHADSDGRNL